MIYRVSVRSNIANTFPIVLIFLFPLFLAACMNVHVVGTEQPSSLIKIDLVTPTSFVPTATSTITPSPTVGFSPSPTITPSSSLTPTVSTTPTPTNTITPGPIIGTLKTDSRCRTGPGIVYPIAFYLNQGESVNLEGRNFDSSWMFIVKEGTTEDCWVNSSLINIDGEFDRLIVIAPPPTPVINSSPTPSMTKSKDKSEPELGTPTPAPPYPGP